ncbi:PREDICTED: ribonuclease E/G-like protein, chloroplastic isoform X2 [Populus euphratica]|uniref:Ribonuclease E/G-like protein, chloroplastic isoform X2 n=1 Tax=Populus euphratica TaxID=75702 RepID=A0AAJ6TC62_POPEU|nr:PREDICTED: ribonuclease E/G-like protein, chloroplastic isoform X2 [Populus euphratica]
MGFMDRGEISTIGTFKLCSNQSALTDEHVIAKHLNFKEPKAFLNDLKVNNKSRNNDEDCLTATYDCPNSVFHERDQPLEEPWLLQSPVNSVVFKDKLTQDVSKNSDTVEDGLKKFKVNDQGLKVKDKLSANGSNLNLKDDSVSTVILISSSICTMQRIAVLEDEKLVELLLEPVKNTVLCDSVYIGVVTKLVPHMGGAFVNIGSSRPSLMDIKQNREPFIFPPFCQRKKKGEVNGSVLKAFEEHPAAHENEHTSHDVDDVSEFVFHGDLAPFLHDDHEEHEVDDDFDVSEVKENVNGSIVDYGEVDADFEQFLDRKEHYLEGDTASRSTEPNYPSVSHQDIKDAKHTLTSENNWSQVRKGTKVIVQVVKEGLGTKGPTVTAYPKLRSRFWILITRCDRIGVSKKVSGVERTRLKVIAKTLQPPGFGLTVRTVAAGHSFEELQKDLEGLLSTWKSIMEHAKSAALAEDEGVEGAIPVVLHRAMGQTLSVVQDYFSEKVRKMMVDSPRTYHEVTNYLQEIAPDLCGRVELYDKRTPLFDEFKIEEEINNILSKRVPLSSGGSLVIEQTEALVSIDVNGGHVMLRQRTSQEKAILDVNLAAAKQIARELRLRDIGGIIVVDFIDMEDESNKRLVYEAVKRAVERDRSTVKVSELSNHGLMEITRKRVRPSVTFMISEPCTCCHATGRVEALETSFSKIEQEICRLLATMDQKADHENPKTWPKFILRVDHHMCNYLTSGKRTRLAVLSSSLKVWILLKVARGFTRGAFEVKHFTDDKANKDQQQVAISVLRQAEARAKKSGGKVTLVPVKKGKAGRK